VTLLDQVNNVHALVNYSHSGISLPKAFCRR
jgi:hypothetical protein